MTSEGLGEMFEGDFADMCTEVFLHMLMWVDRPFKRADGKGGPPLA